MLLALAEKHALKATGFAIAGSVASFVDQATAVLQLVSAIAATVVGVVTAYVQCRKLLRERRERKK